MPLTLTDGTIWNPSSGNWHLKLQPGDTVQQVLLNCTSPGLANVEKGGSDFAYFIHTPNTPDHLIARVEKVTWNKVEGVEIHPLITLGDGSRFLLAAVSDGVQSIWKAGMSTMVLKNCGDAPSPYSFVQPLRVPQYHFDTDVVQSNCRQESFVDTRVIPEGEYTIESW